MRGTFEFDVAAECAGMAEMAEAYDAAFMAAPTPGHQEAGPVFVVGMPRSGTTLVERLLVQSGQVVSAGEPQDFGHLLLYNSARMRGADTTRTLAQASTGLDLAAIGREYMRGLREIIPGSTLFIDKMPANFMFCGAILKALPEARIIHLVRDPLDSCYAMYKTLFFNMYPFSYDQAELAGYFVGYRRLMAHWHLGGDRGAHKAADIRARYDLSRYTRIHAYGDRRKDLPMLGLAHERWYRGKRIA